MPKLEQIIADVLNLPLAAVTDELGMKNTSAWSSLTHLEIIISLEREFGIDLTAEEIVSMVTVRDVRAQLTAKACLDHES